MITVAHGIVYQPQQHQAFNMLLWQCQQMENIVLIQLKIIVLEQDIYIGHLIMEVLGRQ